MGKHQGHAGPWRVAGASLMAAGIALNEWALEATIVPDGSIESLPLSGLILLVDLGLITLGLLVWQRRSEWVAKTLLSATSLIVTLLALEGGFRVLGIRPEYAGPRTDTLLRPPDGATEPVPWGFIPFTTARSVYPSDPRGYFGPGNSIDHVHNSVGWRDREHAVEKPPGTFRILGLGDSYLWGQGVRHEDVVLTRIGELLAGHMPDLDVETINTAMSGTNTVHQRDLLEGRGLDYDPDLVILFFVLNDVEEDPTTNRPKIEFFKNYTSIYQEPDLISRYSHLWGWARQRFKLAYEARRYVKQSVSSFTEDDAGWEHTRRALDDIRRLTSERGIPLLVVIFPFFHDLDGDYPFQVVHDAVRECCQSFGIPVLDLRDSYRDFRGPELWVHPTDQHPNEIAHDIAARAIARHLIEHSDPLLRGATAN